MKLSKSDLVFTIAVKAGISQAAAARALDTVTDTIQKTLAAGEAARIPGLGTFSVAHRAARIGHVPATGKKVKIPPRMAPKFSASQALKDAVRRGRA